MVEVSEAEMKYHANVERGNKYWLVYVPEIDQWTQARSLREVDEMARDLIALVEEVDPESFEIEVRWDERDPQDT